MQKSYEMILVELRGILKSLDTLKKTCYQQNNLYLVFLVMRTKEEIEKLIKQLEREIES